MLIDYRDDLLSEIIKILKVEGLQHRRLLSQHSVTDLDRHPCGEVV